MGSVDASSHTGGVDFLSVRPIPCIIDNVAVTTGKTYPVYRIDIPSSSPKEVLHEVSCCTPSDAKKAVDAAWTAFPAWKATSVSTRREILHKAVSLIQERTGEYMKQTMQETCLSRGMAGFELSVLATTHLKEAAACIHEAIKSEILPPSQEHGGEDTVTKIVKREPFGVVVGIAPWNAPFLLALRSILYPIIAGNTAILKTSEFAPRVHTAVAQILIDAGLPKGVLNVVHVDPRDAAQVTEALISHPAVRKVNFTGSTRVGKIIAGVCANYLKPCVLELGGKAPVVVCKDADLELAANGILFGGYLNSNQICMAVNNVLVDETVKEKLEQTLQTMFEKNKGVFTAKHKQELDSEHAMRSLFSPPSGERLKVLYEDAISHGAKVSVGKPGFEGALIQPIILSGVDSSMKIYSEETFGPVLSIITFKDVEEAIQIANSNDAGLAASVYSKDLQGALKIAEKIQAGQVHVNAQPVHDDPAMPHGGWKASGYGRFNGKDGIREFTQTKGITVQKGSLTPFQFV